jgi:hypothetical protein
MIHALIVIGVLIALIVIAGGVLFAFAAITNARKYQEDCELDDAEQIHYIEEYNRRKASKKRSS